MEKQGKETVREIRRQMERQAERQTKRLTGREIKGWRETGMERETETKETVTQRDRYGKRK